MIESRGEVFDLGYQHYDGPREGRMRVRKAIWFNGMRTALGIGRGSRAKILPVMLFVFTIAPAVIMTLFASAAGSDEDIPSHADYYRIVSVVLLLFSAIIAPELLCSDRRNGVIYLYLVRPLTINDYLAGRWLAFFSITSALIFSGQVILLIGLILAADEPVDYLRDNWLDIPRFIGAGLVIAVFTTTLPLAVSAFTTRRAYATAFIIGLYFVSAVFAGILTSCDQNELPPEGSPGYERALDECEPQIGEAGKWFGLIDMGRIPVNVHDMIMNDDDESQVARNVKKLPTAVPVLWYLLIITGLGFVLLRRYQRIRI